MVLSLFRKTAASEPVYAVYAAIVAQSRQPRFYADWGVPDTVTGRFDMISLHLALLFRRLRGETGPARVFSQSVFDLFFKDMDRSLREMGAGDLAVPKKIKKMGNIFYGLLASLDVALSGGDVEAVELVLLRNVYGSEASVGSRQLAQYLLDESAILAAQSAAGIIAGQLDMGEVA
jgi:cytochrome b pre-mRNA-processing protein 3